MPQPATAGIVLGCIFGGAAALYLAYRAYTRWQRRRRRGPQDSDSDLPPIRSPAAFYQSHSHNGMPYSPSQPSIYGGGGRASRPVSAAWSYPALGPVTNFDNQPNLSSPHLPTPAAPSYTASDSPSPSHTLEGSRASGSASMLHPLPPTHQPTTPTLTGLEPLLSDQPGTRNSVMSSSSSTMTLKRSYANSAYKGSSHSHSNLSHSSSSPLYGLGVVHPQPVKRSSYLPHSPLNRDAIQIIPPQPLGIGLGGLATALDQRTLAFSPASGIGDGNSEIFAQGIIWPAASVPSSPTAENHAERGKRASSAATSRTPPNPDRSSFGIGVDQRLKYLQEGPARQASPLGSVPATMPGGSNDVGDSGAPRPTLEPAAPIHPPSTGHAQSRSRSPADRSLKASSTRSNKSANAADRASEGLHPGYVPSAKRDSPLTSDSPETRVQQDSAVSSRSQYGPTDPSRPPLSRETTPKATSASIVENQGHASAAMPAPAPVRPALPHLLSSSSHHSSAEAYRPLREDTETGGGTERGDESDSAVQQEHFARHSQQNSPNIAQQHLLGPAQRASPPATQLQSLINTTTSSPDPLRKSEVNTSPALACPPLPTTMVWSPSSSTFSSPPDQSYTTDHSPSLSHDHDQAVKSSDPPSSPRDNDHTLAHTREASSSDDSRVVSSLTTSGSGSGSGSGSVSGSGSTTTGTAGSSTDNLATLVEEPLRSSDNGLESDKQHEQEQREEKEELNGGKAEPVSLTITSSKAPLDSPVVKRFDLQSEERMSGVTPSLQGLQGPNGGSD